MNLDHDRLPHSSRQLALMLQQRYPADDGIAALAKAAVRPRNEIEQALDQDGDIPGFIRAALSELPETLHPGDASAKDHIFKASTNDSDAGMEVDQEAGLVVQPAEKPMPSQSGSQHEMRSKPPKAPKNQEFLPVSGMPEAVAPLHRRRES